MIHSVKTGAFAKGQICTANFLFRVSSKRYYNFIDIETKQRIYLMIYNRIIIEMNQRIVYLSLFSV